MKVKNILVSQPTPVVAEKSPFFELAKKFNANVDYRPFIKVEGVTLKEFRSQRVEILEHDTVIFTSRATIDNFFRICEEARIAIPEGMKYLCNTEAVALYLQKYIVYRKRKISFASGSFTSFMELIMKHKSEKILLTLAEPYKPELPNTMEQLKLNFNKVVLSHTVSADVKDVDLKKYDLLVFYSRAEINSLVEAFGADGIPMIAAFSDSTVRAASEAGLAVNVMAPTVEAPSMAKALDLFIPKINAGEDVPLVKAVEKRVAEEFVKAQESKGAKRTRVRKEE